jgi:two-component system phosphate regulon response regulator PhoB
VVAGETILVVEDTELLRRIYVDKLTQEGWKVLTAPDGRECLEVLRDNDVDLVLLDLVMPRMSGLEALEAMKADSRTRDIPVIVLSNLGQESDVERGLNLGASDYLIKNSAKPADVAVKIRALLADADAHRVPQVTYHLHVRDRERDADRLIADAGLSRRFWCAACEEELALELVPDRDRPGWYSARFVCPACGKPLDD